MTVDIMDEELVPMGEFEDARLFYVPTRHAYLVVLGDLREEFRAVWEPGFGMDVDDARTAEEALDRLLARRLSESVSKD